jgi:hypothetical protein
MSGFNLRQLVWVSTLISVYLFTYSFTAVKAQSTCSGVDRDGGGSRPRAAGAGRTDRR